MKTNDYLHGHLSANLEFHVYLMNGTEAVDSLIHIAREISLDEKQIAITKEELIISLPNTLSSILIILSILLLISACTLSGVTESILSFNTLLTLQVL